MKTEKYKIFKNINIIRNTKIMFVKAFIAFVLVFFIFEYGKYEFIRYYMENQKKNVIYTGKAITDRIAMNMYLTADRLKSFANFSMDEYGNTVELENNARSIMQDGQIKYIVVDSDQGKKQVYPYDQTIAEYDFLNEDQSDRRGDMSYIKGPILLKDGKVFLVVEVSKVRAQGNWSRVYGLLEYPKVLKDNCIDVLENQNYYYKLSSIDNGKEIVNMSSHMKKIQDGVTISKEILDKTWYLTIEPQDGWRYDDWDGILSSIIFGMSILFAIGIFNYFRFKDTSRKLTKLVNIDTLTGVFSRKYFFDYATSAIQRNKRFGLFYIDVDKFKKVNDQYGHDTGDRLLCKIAEALQMCIRKNDFVSRIGGDEFVVFISDINEKFDYRILLKRFTNLAKSPCIIKNKKIQNNLSIGYAAFPEGGTDVEALLHEADMHMYKMKEHNRKIDQYHIIRRNRFKKCIVNKSF